MDSVIKLVKESRNIIFFTGAGVSTNCGLPDFRGEKGLYSYVESKYNLPYPEAIFELDYFNRNPKPFFKLSRELLNSNVQPSKTHNFITWLEQSGKLSLVVTQNIDMLHEKSGTRSVLPCHGTYERATCLKCRKEFEYSDIKKDILNGEVPRCACSGVIKPNITFFGENLPKSFYDVMDSPPEADLVIVVGSSLNVQPAASFPLLYRGSCPIVIVNRDKTIYDDLFTYVVNEDCDLFCNRLWEELRSNI